ncbi:SRPBCC family protein [Paenibacillus pasadenensis]|uniref:SRPBCC family protein n=1 Tax=Paenibacillus TaxID=44249 RepID=UPI000418F5FF|nr:SRPBCC domain-containing protein [Paenibacillus pasadenensis]
MDRNADQAEGRPVGLTADAGWQIGVRRTLGASAERIWRHLTGTEAGLALWLGDARPRELEPGSELVSSEGIESRFVVVKPGRQLRLRWRLPEWDEPSTLQIRLLPSGEGRTAVSFHQERLAGPAERELMKRRWEQALGALRDALEDGRAGDGESG